jgi:hypothetical protein
MAAEEGHTESVRVLVQSGADIDILDDVRSETKCKTIIFLFIILCAHVASLVGLVERFDTTCGHL